MGEQATTDESRSLLADVLRGITLTCARHPKQTLILVAIATLISIGYTCAKLEFKTDRSDLIDPSTAFHQRWLRYTESFGESSDLVVVVEAESPETIKQVLDRLGTKLKKWPALFENVLYKVEAGKLRSKGLQYLPPSSLADGLERLEQYRPILNGRWEMVRLEGLIPLLQYQLTDLASGAPKESEHLWDHAEILSKSLARFARDRNDFINPWPEILSIDPSLRDQGNQTVYMLNEAGTMGFLMATPVKSEKSFEGATVAIDRLRELMAETASETPSSRILLTGIPVLENDEMRRSQEDSIKASLISFGGVALLFFLGFRGLRHPSLGMIVLAVGMAWSFGYTTLVIGHLNILSVAFASIVIGLGNDFAIHLLSRYLDLRHHGRDVRLALVEAAGAIGPGIVTGAVTTSLAFFCAGFTSFLGVAELGIIAGGGLLLCTLATFTCLPALVAIVDRRSNDKALPVPFQGKFLCQLTSTYPRAVVIGSLVLFSLIAWRSFDWSGPTPTSKLVYDHNLLHLQAKGLESVEAQKRIFESSNNSLLYAITVADSAEQARALKAQFEKLPTVRHVEELATRLPTFSPLETQLLVQGFHANLAQLPEELPPPHPVAPADVGQMLDRLYETCRKSTSPVAQRAAIYLDQFLNQLDVLELPQQTQLLTEFQYRLSYSLLAQFQALAFASDPVPVSVNDLPAELTTRYVSPKGQWLLQVFPNDQIWDMEPLARFVKDVRSVDPEITGTPLQNFEAAQQIKQSYEVCAVYSLVVILLVLLLDFLPKELIPRVFVPPAIVAGMIVGAIVFSGRTVPLAGLALSYAVGAMVMATWWDRKSVVETLVGILPPLLGLLLTFGILANVGLALNPANLIILPLIIGIGVDNGVHVLHDYHNQRGQKYRPSPSLVNAISMTTSTSIVGFGSMMISAHQGLYSLGAVLAIGVASCVFLALVTLPAVLAIVATWRVPPTNAMDSEGDQPSSTLQGVADQIRPGNPSAVTPRGDVEPRILTLPKVPRVA